MKVHTHFVVSKPSLHMFPPGAIKYIFYVVGGNTVYSPPIDLPVGGDGGKAAEVRLDDFCEGKRQKGGIKPGLTWPKGAKRGGNGTKVGETLPTRSHTAKW